MKTNFVSPSNVEMVSSTSIMASKHHLSKAQQARGLRKALLSKRTPPWLKPSMKRYLDRIERELQPRGKGR
jgi:hypothetical protein